MQVNETLGAAVLLFISVCTGLFVRAPFSPDAAWFSRVEFFFPLWPAFKTPVYPEVLFRVFTRLGFYQGVKAAGVGGFIFPREVLEGCLNGQRIAAGIRESLHTKGEHGGPGQFHQPGCCCKCIGRYPEERGKHAVFAILALVGCIPDDLARLECPDKATQVMTMDQYLALFLAGLFYDPVRQLVPEFLVGKAGGIVLQENPAGKVHRAEMTA